MDYKRDAKGRFGENNPGGPGRVPLAKEEQYLKIFHKVVTPKEFETVCATALRQAQKGDDRARKWITDYLLGAPIQRTQHTGQDGGSLEVVLKWFDENNDASPS